jgi:type II restriction enzyme
MNVPEYLTPAKGTPQFASKTTEQRELVNQAIYVLDRLGIPIAGRTPRQLEGMAVAFLAVIDIDSPDRWKGAKDLRDGRSMSTREIIEYVNDRFGEKISRGSYDDIRRQHLKLPVLAEVVVRSKPGAARNDPERGYALNPDYAEIIRLFGVDEWDAMVTTFMAEREALREVLAAKRVVQRLPIKIKEGLVAEFGPGEHNELIKAVIEDFLTRYGFEAQVLYVGDAENKMLHVEKEVLAELKFFDLTHGELPDVIAYSRGKNWLYLIEAVHTSGPMSAERRLILSRLLKESPAEIIYVTAFLTRDKFKEWAREIAWETEVWIALEADHIIHYDGEQFLGPYKSLPK